MTADVVIIFGTRPSFIKLWSVYKGLVSEGFEPTVICTGQHGELIRQHMGVLDMPVHQWLGVMKDSTGLNSTLSLVVSRVDAILSALNPRLVICHGDTTSGFGAGLAAYHRGIPVAHVEAGLRSQNPFAPWPEELNRIALDALSSLMFAPTPLAHAQARKVNQHGDCELTGNTVVDAVVSIQDRLPQTRYQSIPYVVLELHRRESFPHLSEIVSVIGEACQHMDIQCIWPSHPNPSVQDVAYKQEGKGITIIPPLPYNDFLHLVRDAEIVLTDSGGTIEELTVLKTPSLQIREYTDRPEAIATNMSWMTGFAPHQVYNLTLEALKISRDWRVRIAGHESPYGNSDSGFRIARYIRDTLERQIHLDFMRTGSKMGFRDIAIKA